MTWQDYLEEYYTKYKKNFVVQKFGKFPCPWLNYRTPQYKRFIEKENYVNHREVFPDEIVFDIDMDKSMSVENAKKESGKISAEISNRLESLGFSHSVWESGGCGHHIHLFIPSLYEMNELDRRIMKRCILKTFGHGYIRPRESSGRVQIQPNIIIQLEQAHHRKGGRKKRIYLFENGENPLSSLFDSSFKNEKEKNNHIAKYFKEFDLKKKPAAIVFLETEQYSQIKDGRDRALFILTAYYKQFVKDKELFDTLHDWNKRILGNYFSQRIIRGKMKSARPGLPVNMIIELFDELGLPQSYITELIDRK